MSLDNSTSKNISDEELENKKQNKIIQNMIQNKSFSQIK
jgi:hypothetical protein